MLLLLLCSLLRLKVYIESKCMLLRSKYVQWKFRFETLLLIISRIDKINSSLKISCCSSVHMLMWHAMGFIVWTINKWINAIKSLLAFLLYESNETSINSFYIVWHKFIRDRLFCFIYLDTISRLLNGLRCCHLKSWIQMRTINSSHVVQFDAIITTVRCPNEYLIWLFQYSYLIVLIKCGIFNFGQLLCQWTYFNSLEDTVSFAIKNNHTLHHLSFLTLVSFVANKDSMKSIEMNESQNKLTKTYNDNLQYSQSSIEWEHNNDMFRHGLCTTHKRFHVTNQNHHFVATHFVNHHYIYITLFNFVN